MSKRFLSHSLRRILDRLGMRILIISICIPFFIPLLWMLSTALKSSQQVIQFPPKMIPDPIMWSNFSKAVTSINFLTYLKNTVIVVIFSVTGTIFSCSLVAYGFSKIKWKGREVLFLVTIMTMMLPFPSTLIPTFMIFSKIGLINTLASLWLLSFLGTPYYIFLLRQFYRTIPNVYMDAARIDGLGEFRIFLNILLPLTKPILVIIALFQFLSSWNDFLKPLLYLMEERKYTLSLGLQEFKTTMGTSSWTDWNLLMAASTLTVLPTIIIFFLSQKLMVDGITVTGIKG